MKMDGDTIAFVLGLPVGALIAGLFGLVPEIRRVLLVACVVLFGASCALVGLERVVAVLGEGAERFFALRFFSAAVASGFLITLFSLPRNPRPPEERRP